jgi:hypothetical protein
LNPFQLGGTTVGACEQEENANTNIVARRMIILFFMV